MNAAELAEEVRSRLRTLADPKFGQGMRGFFKAEINPWGVRTIDLQRLVSTVSKECRGWSWDQRVEFSDALWQSSKFEEAVLVCHLWRRFPKPFGRDEWGVFAGWIDRYVSNWAHCDGVASWLLSACLEGEPALIDELIEWARSENRWKRRACAVALLQEAKQGRNTEHIFEVAKLLEHDSDDLVRKGLGWLLKEAYPKKPDELFQFVSSLHSSRVVIRYAAEKMSAKHRAGLGLKSRPAD